MSKFKVGDRVKCKIGYTSNSFLPMYGGAGYYPGYEFIVYQIRCGDAYFEKDENMGVLEDALELCNNINNNINNMTIIDKIKLNLLGEPLKTLVKNDIRNSDGSLTSNGKELFNLFLEKKYTEEFNNKILEDIAKIELEDKK